MSSTHPSAQKRYYHYLLALVQQAPQDWPHIEEEYRQIQRLWQEADNSSALLELLWAVRIYQDRRGLLLAALQQAITSINL